MANKHKGEVSFKIDGQEWTLRFSTNALCELEEKAGCGALGFVQQMADWEDNPGKIEFTKLRLLFWAGLTDNHDVDVKQAGKLISELSIDEAMPKVMEAFQLAFPEQDEGEGKPKAAAN